MGKFLKVLFCFIIVDFYFFSTPLSFTHGYNTKELMAVFGIFLFIVDLSRQKKFAITNEFLGLLVYSGLISLTALFSAIIHNTQERAYTTYFISMLVWLSAAFVVIKCIKGVHGRVTIELLAKYIIAVAVAQGLIAVIADNYPPLDNFIMSAVPGAGYGKTVNRLYGFGQTASFDSGGIRFAIASVLCAHNIKILVQEDRSKGLPLYVLAFFIITVTGNMVARTTLVGTGIGLAYLIYYISPFRSKLSATTLKAWIWILMEASAIVIIVVSLYNTDEKFRFRTRFAFEGFFSMVEEGRWQTGSNDRLMDMYVFPDNPETWLIGDGYFVIPGADPNYMGEGTEGYYMGTDVGYLRFIFFFGLIGLIIYSLYIIYAGKVCLRMHSGNTLLFISLTAMNFVVWFKVATDCFFILCLFICLGYVRDHLPELIEDSEE